MKVQESSVGRSTVEKVEGGGGGEEEVIFIYMLMRLAVDGVVTEERWICCFDVFLRERERERGFSYSAEEA